MSARSSAAITVRRRLLAAVRAYERLSLLTGFLLVAFVA